MPNTNRIESLLSKYAWGRRATILFILLIWGWIDIATGYEYSFAVFYLVPVSIAAWLDNKKVTVLTIIASGLTWLYADYVAGHHYSNVVIPYWNAIVRLGFFSVVALLLIKVRENLTAMTEMAMRDNLTSLHNTRAFFIQYHQIRAQKTKIGQTVAVALIDMDGFKAVNDHHGHSVGDEVLIAFAQVLKNVARSGDIVARMGGDEFIMILKDTDQNGMEIFEKRLRAVFLESELKQ